MTAPPPLPADSAAALPAPRFTCRNCGAQTYYAPGTSVLRCPACGTEQTIEDDGRSIVEHSYDEWASLPPKPVATIAKQVLQCQNCGATTETDLLAGRCQFCSGVLIALASPPGLIVPEAVVAFGIDQQAANTAFAQWVRSRWFAPNALKKVGSTEAIKGTYVPHWTYDAQTQTDYAGQRGVHYWVTVSRTVSDGQGGTRQESVQEMRTQWWPASGQVARDFDDVVVRASRQLPPERLEQAGPWELARAVPYRAEFLAGYSALRYDVDPDAGLQDAREQMSSVIENDCRADIGGDEQLVSHMDVRYAAIMFKLILLPLWIASYLHAGKTFQVLVNANTGEVVGARPVSKVKVALAVLAALIVIAVVLTLYLLNRSNGSAPSRT
jgi:Zn finger protein HypA/HybF involved in hydrogenase expression